MSERRIREERVAYGAPQDDDAPPQPVIDLDKNRRARYVQLDLPVLRAKGLSARAKLVYCELRSFAWHPDAPFAFPGQQVMAEHLEVSVDTVQRALVELRDYGLITWRQVGLRANNRYYLIPISDCPRLDNRDPEAAEMRQPEAAEMRHQDTARMRHEVDQVVIDEEEVDPSYRSFVPPPPVGDEPARVSRGGAAAQGTGAIAPSVPIRSSGGPRPSAVREVAGHEVAPPSQRRGAERDTSADGQADQCWSAWKSALGREPEPAERAGIGRWLAALRRGGVVFTARQWHYIFHEAARTPGARSVVALARTIAADCPGDAGLADFTKPPPRTEGWAVPEVTVPESAMAAMRRASPGVYE